MSIRARLALGVALLTVGVVLVVAAVQFLALRSFLGLAERERLELLVPALETALDRQLGRAARAPLDLSALPRSVDIRVLQAGRVLAQTQGFPPISPGERPGYRPLAGHNVLIAPIRLQGRPATAQIGSDLLGILNPLRAYLRALAITAPAAALLAALLSFALAGRLLRPLADLERAAARLGQGGHLRSPLPGATGRDELGRLAATLQTSFAQLAEVREREEAFTQAAAHDLRSPLAALKTRLQGSLAGPRSAADLRDDVAEALADVERMRRLTEHLLLLAHGSRAVQRLPLDLAHLTGEAVDRARVLSPETNLDFETQGQTAVLGDETLLTHLIDNLIENGLRHGHGADMQVKVSGDLTGVRLSIRDHGPGVPEAALTRLTEAFYRADPARGGHGNGLGLAIAHRAALAHGAALSFQNGQPRGLHVVLTFPPAQGPGLS
ncbi:sensor histidine kinase [Deinococcus sp.]|uniref:sensor histidine kinase n=1 Tax=Deinococcus sp. TaxID=47478 RepID=UPI003CC6B9C9